MKQGFGLGVGLEAARAAIGGIAGTISNTEKQPENQIPENQIPENEQSCQFEKSVWEKCSFENNSRLNCDDIYKLWEKCRINSQESIDSILM